ncbi:MAG: hypothetical protein M3290_03810 [Actinomycetota bacterium]|nr:hypothetical protein [Actinomycetota bacterium]
MQRIIGSITVAMVAAIAILGSPAAASWPGKDGDIFVVRVSGTNATIERHLPDGSPAETVVDCMTPGSRMQTSPDGKLLVYSCAADGDAEIYLTHLGQGDAIKLTDNTFSDVDPAFSPDATRIVFSSDRDGNFELYTLDIASLQATRLTNDPGTDVDPVWSVAGGCGPEQVYFVSNRDGDNEIWAQPMDGQSLRQVTTNTVDDGGPDISGNGCGLVYNEVVNGVSQIMFGSAYPGQADTIRPVTSGPDNSFDAVLDPKRVDFVFSRQAQAPGSPIRVYRMPLGGDATLLPGQTAGSDYGQAEWAVQIEGGSNHARAVSLALKKHLKATGQVTVSDGNNACADHAFVVIQKRNKARKWVDLRSGRSSAPVSQGVSNFSIALPDKPGSYRAKLATSSLAGGTECGGAISATRKHIHH